MDNNLREILGRLVRYHWIEYCKTLSNPKQTWLEPWSNLSEEMKEVDRVIGVALYNTGWNDCKNNTLISEADLDIDEYADSDD